MARQLCRLGAILDH